MTGLVGAFGLPPIPKSESGNENRARIAATRPVGRAALVVIGEAGSGITGIAGLGRQFSKPIERLERSHGIEI